MHTNLHRFTKSISLGITAILLLAFTGTPAQLPGTQQPASPSCTNPAAHLELSVQPTIALPDTLVTLNIKYVRIGLPYTGISMDSPGLVVFDPPLSMPCKYSEHPEHCTAITLRTQATGVVTFHAGATGEIFDEECQCFCMGSAQDDGPVTLVIAETISHVYLPSVYR